MFSSAWLQQKLELAIEAVGPRYTPEVNVDLDVGFAFDGLGRTEVFDERLGEGVAALRRATRFTHLSHEEPKQPRRLRSAVERVTRDLDTLAQRLGQMSVRGADSIA